MNKPKLNYTIDFLAFISFVVVSVSGLAIKAGASRGRSQEMLGIQKGAWNEIHDWSGTIFIILVVIHLILHWRWIACMTRNIFQSDKCENKTSGDT
jgi:cytochrome b subunit of formate dehydrogenase